MPEGRALDRDEILPGADALRADGAGEQEDVADIAGLVRVARQAERYRDALVGIRAADDQVGRAGGIDHQALVRDGRDAGQQAADGRVLPIAVFPVAQYRADRDGDVVAPGHVRTLERLGERLEIVGADVVGIDAGRAAVDGDRGRRRRHRCELGGIDRGRIGIAAGVVGGAVQRRPAARRRLRVLGDQHLVELLRRQRRAGEAADGTVGADDVDGHLVGGAQRHPEGGLGLRGRDFRPGALVQHALRLADLAGRERHQDREVALEVEVAAVGDHEGRAGADHDVGLGVGEGEMAPSRSEHRLRRAGGDHRVVQRQLDRRGVGKGDVHVGHQRIRAGHVAEDGLLGHRHHRERMPELQAEIALRSNELGDGLVGGDDRRLPRRREALHRRRGLLDGGGEGAVAAGLEGQRGIGRQEVEDGGLGEAGQAFRVVGDDPVAAAARRIEDVEQRLVARGVGGGKLEHQVAMGVGVLAHVDRLRAQAIDEPELQLGSRERGGGPHRPRRDPGRRAGTGSRAVGHDAGRAAHVEHRQLLLVGGRLRRVDRVRLLHRDVGRSGLHQRVEHVLVGEEVGEA